MSIVHLATFLIEKKKFYFFSKFTMKIKRKKKNIRTELLRTLRPIFYTITSLANCHLNYVKISWQTTLIES